MAKRWFALLGLALVLMMTFIRCGEKNGAEDKPVLTVSIPPQKYLLEQIVGEKFVVNSLLSPGTNPENYDPSMNHLIGMQNSKAYLRMGNIGFEAAALSKINDNFPDLKIYNTSAGVPLIRGTHGHHHGHHEMDVDPHVWTSVKNAKIIAENMYKAMVEIDSSNKDYYQKRYEALRQDLELVDDSITRLLAPIKGETFLVWHPSLTYMARDYGLKQMSVEYEGKEATADHLKHIIDDAKAVSPKVFFYQKEYDSRQAELISKEIGTSLTPVNLMNYEWKQEMYNIANTLAPKRDN